MFFKYINYYDNTDLILCFFVIKLSAYEIRMISLFALYMKEPTAFTLYLCSIVYYFKAKLPNNIRPNYRIILGQTAE